jgi:deoxyribodipyrimidine photo-lyase
MTERPIAIMWFRSDLRLADNPALLAAQKWAKEHDGAVLPVFILDPVISDQLGGATKWWLEKSLTALNRDIAELGDTKSDRALRLFAGDVKSILENIADDKPVQAVFWNRLYDKPSTKRDTDIKTIL